MRTRAAWQGIPTTLGFVPALQALVVAASVLVVYTSDTMSALMADGDGLGPLTTSWWCLGVLVLAYTAWILGVARRRLSTATGGGFVIAGASLCLRIMVEPVTWGQRGWSEGDAEVFLSLLHQYRLLGLIGFFAGLAVVGAAVVSEAFLRRRAPDWVLPD